MIRKYLDHTRPAGALEGLTPVSPPRLAEVRAAHPWISPEYLEFLGAVGVGTCPLLNIYEPIPLEDVTGHTSYSLYGSSAYRGILGVFSKPRILPKDAVIFADTGASWRYCFSRKHIGQVLCFDMACAEFSKEADSFPEFLDRDLFPL